ncbi:hypothetical protein HAX54_022024 [Datura stramonium]|uniref:Uncharacterized protein n=1 Tax=Datura stramonium TaxID=4076 RepID=A0ABS8UTT0_DATST|nr:hypothetical protein [Datura stramonium]
MNRGEDMLPEKPRNYRLFIHSYQDEIDLWHMSPANSKLVKVLDLESLNIGGTFPSEVQSLIHLSFTWSVSDDAFPKLERLVLTKCKQLEEIPSHFGDAISLKSIEVNSYYTASRLARGHLLDFIWMLTEDG